MPNSNFYSNGKLLLTGEYVVLDGAVSLALPTKFGQTLEVFKNKTDFINWKSFDENDNLWFETILRQDELEVSSSETSHENMRDRLIQILKVAKQINPDFLNSGFSIETKLSFPRNWGLGTSSTLINNIATWAQVDPYELLEETFKGSGYDIACAQYNEPITYRLTETGRDIQTINFNPEFKDCLYFVYLNKKQNSRDAIQSYRENKNNLTAPIVQLNKITKNIISAKKLTDFNNLITQHEQIIGSILKQEPIKNRLFNDFSGSIKSLGAWGGVFILFTATENPSVYFKAKGFETVISYKDLIL